VCASMLAAAAFGFVLARGLTASDPVIAPAVEAPKQR
jgi:hypothetical protein